MLKVKYNDASIKSKDVTTDENGRYSTTDNISILNIVSLTRAPNFAFNIPIRMFYSIFHDNESNKTIVDCYYNFSYIDHEMLNKYLDNNRSDDISISASQVLINMSSDIRLYYI